MRNVWKCGLGLLVGLGVLAGNAGAQFKNGSQPTELNIPRLSQRGTVSQRIGLTDVTIVYHRPEEIGRASCRERVKDWEDEGGDKKKNDMMRKANRREEMMRERRT